MFLLWTETAGIVAVSATRMSSCVRGYSSAPAISSAVTNNAKEIRHRYFKIIIVDCSLLVGYGETIALLCKPLLIAVKYLIAKLHCKIWVG